MSRGRADSNAPTPTSQSPAAVPSRCIRGASHRVPTVRHRPGAVSLRLLSVTALELEPTAAGALLIATELAELLRADGYERPDAPRVETVLELFNCELALLQ